MEGRGTEEHKTAVEYLYGTVSAGGDVAISADHVSNGIVENAGAITETPTPTPNPSLVDAIIDTSLASSANEVSSDPNHNYVIETDPALADPSTFYGSDYFLDSIGLDLDAHHMKLLGDAYVETRLVREQILAQTGKRYLDPGITSDTQQMIALMDNAIAAKSALDLTVGVSLSKEQVAALDKDIIWPEKRTVNGQEVLVPVLYLGRGSLQHIAKGGAVIAGRNVEIATEGSTLNAGYIEAAQKLHVTADTIFNVRGDMQADIVTLAADASVINSSGSITGRKVDISAGDNIESGTSAVSFRAEGFKYELADREGRIEADGDLTMTAGGDIRSTGGVLKSGGDMALNAGGDVDLTTLQLGTKGHFKTGGAESRQSATTHKGSKVSSGGDITVKAGRDVTVHGSSVEAQKAVDIEADGNVAITAATNTRESYYHSESGGGGMFGGSHSETIQVSESDAVQSSIKAGTTLDIKAGGDSAEPRSSGSGNMVVSGSKLESGEDMTLTASGDLAVTTTAISSSSSHSEESSGLMTSKSESSQHSTTTEVGSDLTSGGDLAITSEAADVTVKASHLESDGKTTIKAESGQVAMLTGKKTEHKQKASTDMGAFSWSSKDEGSYDETVLHTTVVTGKGLEIVAADGVVVEYKETGNLRKDVEQLAQAPGLEWMGDLLERDDVDWQAVAEVHEQWKHEDSGIGGPGASLLSLAMAVALSATGVGAPFGISSFMGSATVGAGVTSALNAGFSALVAQAAVQVAGNGGDIGAALQGLASSETVRLLATTMLTAGITSGITTGLENAATTAEQAVGETIGQAASETSTAFITELTDKLQSELIAAGVRTGVDTAINGGDLGENMVANLQGAAVHALGAQMANEIGAAYADGDLDYVTHKIAHAALGGAMDVAMGGDGTAGAIGGVVGEIVGEQFKPSDEDYKQLNSDLKELWLAGKISYNEAENLAKVKVKDWMAVGIDVSKLAAGFAAVAIGGNVDSAANSAENAVENNVVISATVVAAALWATYATCQGDGNFIKGVKVIGAGDDTISKLIEAGVVAATDKAYEIAPENTVWAINKLNALGENANAIFTFTDEATGKVFTRTWSSLPEDTQQLILGSADGIITVATGGLGAGVVASAGKSTLRASVVVTAKKSGKLFTIIDDAYEAKRLAKVTEKTVSAIGDVGEVAAKSGDEVTKVVGKVVVDNMPTQLERIPTSGIKLVTKPEKTTTILGTYKRDMGMVIDELGYPKTLDFDAKPGGFNVLNAPNELYKNPDQFWKEYNKPFLDAAIERGDDIILATEPDKSFFKLGKKARSGFEREIKHLIEKGYFFDENTMKMIKK